MGIALPPAPLGCPWASFFTNRHPFQNELVAKESIKLFPLRALRWPLDFEILQYQNGIVGDYNTISFFRLSNNIAQVVEKHHLIYLTCITSPLLIKSLILIKPLILQDKPHELGSSPFHRTNPPLYAGRSVVHFHIHFVSLTLKGVLHLRRVFVCEHFKLFREGHIVLWSLCLSTQRLHW
ncbi:hypothetical protein E2C01_055825 [Portunus trituberculatus]|uniref:Uncharacterized protein n=1 Tax=Portunus trituberculatus TaxID=210409 RepID=A0A5B7GNI2_PORTR|nr:hypothetical protein [Portunus trituberculatus]